MESLGKILQETFGIKTSVSNELESVCRGCGEKVIQKDIPIIAGPNKGTVRRLNILCKCDDLKLAKEVVEENHKNRFNKYQSKNLISDELKECTLENYIAHDDTTRSALQHAKTFIKRIKDGEVKNLILAGSYGTGKSHLAKSISDILQSHGMPYIFISAPRLFQEIKMSYNKSSDVSEYSFIKELIDVDILVIDDLGAEYTKTEQGEDINHSWTNNIYFNILDGRQGKITIYTTNLSSVEIQKKIGGRNFSRVMKNTVPVKIVTDDYRLRKVEF